ncbi:MAG TPA: isocitrate lyase/PEP mutase family protein [bacterium]|jgi:2-methylisocitrate lyase-like PEP mutase family enzyme|nr:isocitrate lyase/PEP mutase family protein [bacterium]
MSVPQQFRALLQSERLLVLPGVYDGLSARIAEQAGFPALYVSGGAVSRSTGIPDLGLLSVDAVVSRVAEIVRAVTVPCLADADAGYGNPLHAGRAIRAFERAGAAGVHIEDQVEPKQCGHYGQTQVIEAAEMVEKIRAAVDARTDPAFLLVARTDSRASHGLDEAIRRANLYADAGADMVFVEAPQSREELAEIPRRVQVPLLVNMFDGGRTPFVPPADLAAMGYRIMIVPSDLQRAAIAGMQRAAAALREEGTARRLGDAIVSFEERERVVGLAEWRAAERRYARR